MARMITFSRAQFVLAFFVGVSLAPFAASEETETPRTAQKALEQNALHQRILDYIDTSLYGRVPVKDHHKAIHQNGTSCELCHGSKEPITAADTANCANCHGSPEDVAALTEEEFEHNPHDSPHWETEMPCDMCHKEHSESVSACAECHQFGFEIP